MNNKARSDSLLSQLTDDQQAQVYDWLLTLGYTRSLTKLAQPPPEGFGLTTHRNSLQRFFKRYSQQERTEDVAGAKESRPISPEDASVLVSDAEQSSLHAGHQLATGPLNSDDFAKVGHWLEAQKEEKLKRDYLKIAEHNAFIARKKVTLAEIRHAFDREKFELNVARLALQHAAALQRLHADNNLETQARIKAARELLYGPPPQPCQS